MNVAHRPSEMELFSACLLTNGELIGVEGFWLECSGVRDERPFVTQPP